MNDADVLFPWEKEGGADGDAHEPERSHPEAEAHADGGSRGGADAVGAGDADESDTPAGEAGTAADEGAAGAEPGGLEAEPASLGAEAAPDVHAQDAAAALQEDGAPAADAEVSGDGAETGPAHAADDAAADEGAAAAGVEDEARFEVLDTEYARQAAERASAALRDRPVAQKEYYSISEVCELVGLKPHVLRYWETQFQVLNPSKNRSGNRVYQRKEIRLIMLVKHLLYEEKYTVEGAKAKLDNLRRSGELTGTAGVVLDRAMIDQLRADLSELATLLTPPART